MKTHRMTLLTAAAALLSAAGLARDAGAAITRSFNYQGFLLDKAANRPVDGARHVRFLIHASAAGGAALFTETVCGVPMNNGRYEVEVGSNTPGGITPEIFINNPNLWLQVEIAPTASCSGLFDPLSPRVRLQAAPFAFSALYASTAAAATPLFSADVIGPLSQTANGAITISTNLFVQGGISVGTISPGQQLSVSGLVESRGVAGCASGPNFTCGFKFPDGSVQVTAAAETKWQLSGNHMYNITTGNIGIGENVPRARLHVSSGIGEPGNIVLVSTGASDIFRITGEGSVHANRFFGDGAGLTGTMAADLLRVLKTGDAMTGPLTLAGSSSMTVINTSNSLAYSLAVSTDPARRVYHLAVTTAGLVGVGTLAPAARLQIWTPPGFSSTMLAVTTGTSDVFRVDGAGNVHGLRFHGDGSNLTSVFSTDPSKVLKAGDAMTGQLTLAGSSLTVRGSAGLAVNTGEWLSVGASTAAHKVYIDGGMLATSSITAAGGFFGPSASLTGHLAAVAVTAASGTFTAWGPSQYSVETTSGIRVNGGVVDAPLFRGSGAALTNVLGTDFTKLLKAGDTMTGNLRVEGSSVSILGYGNAFNYALAVATVTAASPSAYALAVTTLGRVGVGVLTPSYPFHVLNQIGITVPDGSDDARLSIRTGGGGGGYIAWDDAATPGKGVLGMVPGARELAYRAAGTSMSSGVEVFRIRETGNFGIWHTAAAERLHIGSNMLVSTAAASPILYVSTTTGMVGIGTSAPATHKLVVAGNMVVVSSLAVQGGIHGAVHGVINSTGIYVDGNAGVGVASPLARLHVVERGDEIYTLIVGSSNVAGSNYDMVVTTLGRAGIGIQSPLNLLHVGGTVRVGTDGSLDTGDSGLLLSPLGGASFVHFSETGRPSKATFGTLGGQDDFIYRAGAGPDLISGTEVYRITKPGLLGIYSANPLERLHIGANTLISTAAATPILYASTDTARVGVGTRSPSARLHLSSGAFYNDGAGAGLTTLGNVTAAAYYGSGANLGGVITSTAVIVSDIAARVLRSGDTMTGALATTGLTVSGTANFGSPPTKSTFTAEGFWQPRAMTTTELRGATPLNTGLIVYNSTILDLCVSTGTATAGAWALIGSRAAGNCY